MTDPSKKTPHYLKSYFTFELSVSEPGEDLCFHLNKEPATAEAFEALASEYEQAAAACRRMAGLAREMSDLRVGASGREIVVYGSNDRLEPLVPEGLLKFSPDEEDHILTENVLREQLEGSMHGAGPFTVADVVRRAAQIDTAMEDLNPLWVQEIMSALVEEGILRISREDQYELATK